MAPETFRLDPALEELLVEVAADPDSCLLRVPRGTALPALFENDTRVSDRMAGLRLAERELLRAHRQELADLLVELCRYQIIEGPRSRLFISRYGTDGKEIVPMRPAEIAEAAGTMDDLNEGRDERRALALLRGCVSLEAGIPELAAVAGRLSPSVEARGLAAQSYATLNHSRTALALLRALFDSTMTTAQNATAWTTVGVAYSRQRNYASAHRAYCCASDLDSEYAYAWISRLLLALQAGEESDVLRVEPAIERLALSQAAAVNEIVRATGAGRTDGSWQPTTAAKAAVAKLRTRFGAATTKVCDEVR